MKALLTAVRGLSALKSAKELGSKPGLTALFTGETGPTTKGTEKAASHTQTKPSTMELGKTTPPPATASSSKPQVTPTGENG